MKEAEEVLEVFSPRLNVTEQRLRNMMKEATDIAFDNPELKSYIVKGNYHLEIQERKVGDKLGGMMKDNTGVSAVLTIGFHGDKQTDALYLYQGKKRRNFDGA